MALFTTMPIKITKPSMVSISSAWYVTRLSAARPPMPPTAATGTDSMMIKG